MARYRALVDIPPRVKKGDVVTLKEDPIPEFKSKLEPVGRVVDDEEDNGNGDGGDGTKVRVGNPSRDELKARATELGITFANNTPTDKLLELIAEAEIKVAGDDGQGPQTGPDGNDNPDD